MSGEWIPAARERLLSLRVSGAGWGYREGAAVSVEPSVLATLGLLSSAADVADVTDAVEATAGEVAAWIAGVQDDEGAVGVGPHMLRPTWPTPLALWLWAALDALPEARKKAADYLIARESKTLPRNEVFGHDTSIVGWPWNGGTMAWVEPTAQTVIGLRRAGVAHARIEDAVALLEDRAIASGGWNYGNTTVFGTELRPNPGPTGLALLALKVAGSDGGPAVDSGAAYLEKVLPSVRSGMSLGWGLLGLGAWGRRPTDADAWLAEAVARAPERPTEAFELAFLLLAGGSRAAVVAGSA